MRDKTRTLHLSNISILELVLKTTKVWTKLIYINTSFSIYLIKLRGPLHFEALCMYIFDKIMRPLTFWGVVLTGTTGPDLLVIRDLGRTGPRQFQIAFLGDVRWQKWFSRVNYHYQHANVHHWRYIFPQMKTNGRHAEKKSLRWYMSLLRFCITSYQDLTKRMIHHFSAIKHIKVSATRLFNIFQGYFETLREYLMQFNEETTKIAHPTKRCLWRPSNNGLNAGHFNDSLANKPSCSIEEIMAMAELYIKEEESSTEKWPGMRKNKVVSQNHPYTGKIQIQDRSLKKLFSSRPKNPLSASPYLILRNGSYNIFTTLKLFRSLALQKETPWEIIRANGVSPHRIRGHHTDDCHHLKQEIVKLIQGGLLHVSDHEVIIKQWPSRCGIKWSGAGEKVPQG